MPHVVFFETDKVSIYKAFHCGIVNGGAGAKLYIPQSIFRISGLIPNSCFFRYWNSSILYFHFWSL